MRYRLYAAALVLAAGHAQAQDPAPVYQTAKTSGFQIKGDVMLRREWTQNFVTNANTDPLTMENQSRWMGRARPRVEFGGKGFTLGVGGDFYYSNKDNLAIPEGQTSLGLIRDNFDSRSARLDLAFARVEPASWLRLEAGRFVMPVAFTEMIWDRDLRPQGATATLSANGHGSLQRAAVTGLYSRASHVFDDGKDFFDKSAVQMLAFSGELSLASQSARFQLVGSYVEWDKIARLEPKIRRQNARIAGELVRDYHVFDAVARLTTGGNQPIQLVADFCWNIAKDPNPDAVSSLTFPTGKKGMWLAAVLGSLETSRARIEYVYASVDRDATLAAYTTDDFLWGTGWAGHKVDLATGAGNGRDVHLIAQWQRFKDSPSVLERDHWVARYRIETRISF